MLFFTSQTGVHRSSASSVIIHEARGLGFDTWWSRVGVWKLGNLSVLLSRADTQTWIRSLVSLWRRMKTVEPREGSRTKTGVHRVVGSWIWRNVMESIVDMDYARHM